jgi:alkyl hydroperoxide reductase subunit AhpF
MPLLRDADRRELETLFARQLEHPVTMRFYTQRESPLVLPAQECQTCRETGELLAEIAALSDKLGVERHDFVAEAEQARQLGVDRIPAILFEGQARGRLRYFGVPAGYEFAVLVGAIIDASRGTTALTPATRQQLAALPGPAHLKVLVTPT